MIETLLPKAQGAVEDRALYPAGVVYEMQMQLPVAYQRGR